jgi:hypothetical protein
MRHQILTGIVLTILIAGLAVVDTQAAKPPKPDPEPEPASTIHYSIPYINSPLHGQWVMDDNGGNKTPLPTDVDGEPSAALHDGQRWLLRREQIPGEFYPLHFHVRPMYQDELGVVSFSGDPDAANGWDIDYTLIIDGTYPDHDTFEWWCNRGSLGCPQEGQYTGIEITGLPQDLVFGSGSSTVTLTVQFMHTEGHAIDDTYHVIVAKRPRRVVQALLEDGSLSAPLVDGLLLEPLGNLRWTNSDGLVTFIGQLWDDQTGEAAEAGIYGQSVLFDPGGVPQAVGSPELLVSALTEAAPTGDHCDVTEFSPSPDGSQMVFTRTWEGGLKVATCPSDADDAQPITDFGDAPDWSPSGESIAFDDGPYAGTRFFLLLTSIWTVSPDGTELTMVSETTCRDRGGKLYTECIKEPRWSPDSNYILYSEGDYSHLHNDVYRMRANGSRAQNLTGDTDEKAFPVAWVSVTP